MELSQEREAATRTGNFPIAESPKGSCEWIPLMDYSVRTGLSLSTLRRYIKSHRIEYRLEDGRYLLPLGARDGFDSSHLQAMKAEISRLETELRKAREENAELRMLVALYESSSEDAASTADA